MNIILVAFTLNNLLKSLVILLDVYQKHAKITSELLIFRYIKLAVVMRLLLSVLEAVAALSFPSPL